jgi:phosphogluconate dehydratase
MAEAGVNREIVMTLHPTIAAVTADIVARSKASRAAYLAMVQAQIRQERGRARASCGNLAHAIAASGEDKSALQALFAPNIAIVSAYNDMLSAHQPFEGYPHIIKEAARAAKGAAQFAGGVPAMCDGVTQGRPGMELSLFSRDAIAMATAIALSHDVFDAAVMLGVCDKIVPGLFIGAASYGDLPVLFIPAGPMPSGLPNKEKAAVRQRYAEGKASRDALLAAEMASYHGPGTCTFYGTANSNQVLMEMMGLHLPGAAFINPNTPLRDALTRAAAQRAVALGRDGGARFGEMIDARSLVNAVVGLLATGGSTNHTLHLVAMARAVGYDMRWEDMAALSAVTPLIARVYPNGQADVNHFHAAGGIAYCIRTLMDHGLLHGDIATVFGPGLSAYTQEPMLSDGGVTWRPGAAQSHDRDVLRGCDDPFSAEGGIRLITGDLGQAIMKTSAVAAVHRVIEAPAIVFDDQDDFLTAFKAGKLDRDHVAVIRFQGPSANGMPELHKLTPALSSLLDRGFKVALVTDGRMSGASGKVAAALHVTPEAVNGGAIARVQDGDVIRLDGETGRLTLKVSADALAARKPAAAPAHQRNPYGVGRDLFGLFRAHTAPANHGGGVFPARTGAAPALAHADDAHWSAEHA